MADLTGALVVVTGGGAGVGRALALEATRRGARILIASISNPSESIELIRAAGGQASWFKTDVADYNAMVALAKYAREEHGGANILINNAAGSIETGSLQESAPDKVKRMFEINVLGVFNGIHAFAPDLIASAAAGKPAHILNVGSEHSLGVPPHVQAFSAYTVSKYATLGFTDVARRDFEGTGVNVALLAPGWVLTEKVSNAIDSSSHARAAIEPYAQTGEEVAYLAIKGLLDGQYIIATNPASRAFALEHAREVMAEVQRLPLTDITDTSHAHDGTGDPSKCPVPHNLFSLPGTASAPQPTESAGR